MPSCRCCCCCCCCWCWASGAHSLLFSLRSTRAWVLASADDDDVSCCNSCSFETAPAGCGECKVLASSPADRDGLAASSCMSLCLSDLTKLPAADSAPCCVTDSCGLWIRGRDSVCAWSCCCFTGSGGKSLLALDLIWICASADSYGPSPRPKASCSTWLSCTKQYSTSKQCQ